MLEKMLTQETPAKVMTLLGTAVASMFLLFAISYSNANFRYTEVNFPDPFNQENIVTLLDSAAAGYAYFLDVNLFQPVQNDLAMYNENLKFVIDNSDTQILKYTGLSALSQLDQPKVAGAYTNRFDPPQENPSGVFKPLLGFLGLK